MNKRKYLFKVLFGLVCSVLLIGLSINMKKIQTSEWCEKLEQIKSPKFTNPSKVIVLEKSIPIGLVLIQHKNSSELEHSFKTGVSRMVESLLRHTQSALHFVILTDSQSLEAVGKFLAQIVTKALGTQAILAR